MTEAGLGRAVGAAKRWLQEVEIGEGQHGGNLTVFPLFWRGGGKVGSIEPPPSWGDAGGGNGKRMRYQLLAEAIAAKQAVVEEASEAGNVPMIAVKNDAAIPVLIPEGEILIGAKQNRTVNLTILVAAKTQMPLPVSCVEAGRWRRTSRHFEAKAWAHPKLRELKMRSAQRQRRVSGVARSDQGAVWQEVDEHLCALEAEAPTRDVVASFEVAERRLGDYRRRVGLPAEACGFLVARGDRVIGLDLFDQPETLHKLWRRLSDAYFVEAAREDEDLGPASRDLAKGFLDDLVQRLEPAGRQPALGFEMELVDGAVSGSALWYDGAICHLSAFSTNN